MNNDIIDTSDKEKVIDLAFELCRKTYSESEITKILNGEDDVQKCIAIMNIDKIISQDFADLLLFHLTNHGGTVREAVATKLEILLEDVENLPYFQTDYATSTICDAIIDINPNISRIVLSFINKIENKNLILTNIERKINWALENIYKSDILQTHQINKFYFKLYWLLEALHIIENIDIQKFMSKFREIAKLPEYTVREKLALISKKYDLSELKTLLINDENYYVRKIFE